MLIKMYFKNLIYIGNEPICIWCGVCKHKQIEMQLPFIYFCGAMYCANRAQKIL
jgi:hypothetical protein